MSQPTNQPSSVFAWRAFANNAQAPPSTAPATTQAGAQISASSAPMHSTSAVSAVLPSATTTPAPTLSAVSGGLPSAPALFTPQAGAQISATTPLQNTVEYRTMLLNVCRMDIAKRKCEKPSTCINSGYYHICPDFAGNGCPHGGLGVVHRGGIHTNQKCHGRKQAPCKILGCFQPNTTNLFHAKYSCLSIRENPTNPQCLKGGPTGACSEGHDNPDIRGGLYQSYYTHDRNSLPAA